MLDKKEWTQSEIQKHPVLLRRINIQEPVSRISQYWQRFSSQRHSLNTVFYATIAFIYHNYEARCRSSFISFFTLLVEMLMPLSNIFG